MKNLTKFQTPFITFKVTKKELLSTKSSFFCLSKLQAWYIITARSVVHIIEGSNAALVSHHAPACIALRFHNIQDYAFVF